MDAEGGTRLPCLPPRPSTYLGIRTLGKCYVCTKPIKSVGMGNVSNPENGR